jgi:hypothetical protein
MPRLVNNNTFSAPSGVVFVGRVIATAHHGSPCVVRRLFPAAMLEVWHDATTRRGISSHQTPRWNNRFIAASALAPPQNFLQAVTPGLLHYRQFPKHLPCAINGFHYKLLQKMSL